MSFEYVSTPRGQPRRPKSRTTRLQYLSLSYTSSQTLQYELCSNFSLHFLKISCDAQSLNSSTKPSSGFATTVTPGGPAQRIRDRPSGKCTNAPSNIGNHVLDCFRRVMIRPPGRTISGVIAIYFERLINSLQCNRSSYVWKADRAVVR